MDVLVVGAGAVGRWAADVVDATVVDDTQCLDADVRVTDLDDEVAAETAAATGARAVPIDRPGRADAVVVAVPLSAVDEVIATHAEHATSALIDLTGAMGPPLAAMRATAPELERASLHPLFAPAHAPGRIAVVRDAPGKTVDSILAAFDRAGNELITTTAEEHDAAMETVQAATHAAVLSFGLAAEPVPPWLRTPVNEELVALLERVSGGSPGVYADIQAAFDGADAVAAAARRLADADRDGVASLYETVSDRWTGSVDDRWTSSVDDRWTSSVDDRWTSSAKGHRLSRLIADGRGGIELVEPDRSGHTERPGDRGEP